MNVTVQVRTPVLVEAASGAQVMPYVADDRQTVTTYSAHLAADADMRTKFPRYRVLAGDLLAVFP